MRQQRLLATTRACITECARYILCMYVCIYRGNRCTRIYPQHTGTRNKQMVRRRYRTEFRPGVEIYVRLVLIKNNNIKMGSVCVCKCKLKATKFTPSVRSSRRRSSGRFTLVGSAIRNSKLYTWSLQ